MGEVSFSPERRLRTSPCVVDGRIVDGVVNGVGRVIASGAESMRRLQTGYMRNYTAMFLLGAVVIFSLLMARALA